MDPKDPSAPSRPTFVRAFRPFWITASIGAVLLASDYHARHAPSTYLTLDVTVDSEPPEDSSAVTVNGESLFGGMVAAKVGWRSVIVSAPDADPWKTSRFVWYDRNPLGTIDLKRSRGTVLLHPSPPPALISLSGKYGSFSNSTGFFTNVPAGRYTAGFVYTPELVHYLDVRVIGNQVTTNALTNSIGALELAATTNEVGFSLAAVFGGTRINGRLPHSVPHLPAGEYRLSAKQGDYSLERYITIIPAQTNRVLLEFVYGEIEVASEPPGALVTLRDEQKGTTPLKLEKMVPGRYKVELRKDGFDPVSLDVTVEGTNTAKASVVLVNTRYRVSMKTAGEARLAGNYRTALRALEAALEAQPEDAEASESLPRAKAAALREEAVELLSNGHPRTAEDVLDQADKIEPESPLSKPLRAKIEEARIAQEQRRVDAERRKVDEERRRAEANFRTVIEAAKAEIRAENFDRARVAISEAKKWGPNEGEIPVIEAELQTAQAKAEARVAEQRRQEQIRQRRRSLEEEFEALLRADEFRPVATVVWLTSVPALDVKRACEPVEGKGLNVFDFSKRGADLVTWRNGRLIPLLEVGSYYRFAACSLAPGVTEIRMACYNLGLGRSGKSEPVDDPAGNRKKVEEVGRALAAALKGDLRVPESR